jgi:chemotaxis protein histidine kinase CheA
MAALQSQPFQELAGPLCTQAQTWASSLGKQLSATVKGGAVLVPSSILLRIQAALTHLTRNAVAHGVELPEARSAAHKSPAGALLLSAEDGPLGPSFLIEDDGAGIDIAALQKLSGSSSTELLTLLSAGASTRNVNGLSGLGVGVSAALEELSAVQYRLEVSSTPQRGTRILLRPLSSVL